MLGDETGANCRYRPRFMWQSAQWLRTRRRSVVLPALVASAALLLPTAPAAVADTEPGQAPSTGQGPARDAQSRVLSDRVVVRFEPGTSPSRRAQARAAAGATLLQETNLPLVEVVRTKPGQAAAVAAGLGRRADVVYAEPSVLYSLTKTPNDSAYGSQWPLGNGANDIDAPSAWDFETGDGSVTVGVIDTGIDYLHPDLAANRWVNPVEQSGVTGVDDDGNGVTDDIFGFDFADWDADPRPESDAGCLFSGQSHGTHVAGTIGARGNNSVGVAGVAWDVRLIALDAYDEDLCGLPDYALANSIIYSRIMGADLVNMSLGSDQFSPVIDDAIADSPNLLVVAAAGNSGTSNDTQPWFPCNLNRANVVCVAASTQGGGRASFSNYGRSVDLAAPGVSVLSTVVGGGYAYYQGTSMAAPHVAGAAVLLKSAAPTLTAGQLRSALLTTVDASPAWFGQVASGGRLNVAAALSAVRPPNPAPATVATAPGDRFDGPTRYDTAAVASARTFASGVPVAYIATGGNFPDALAAGPLAGRLGGPVLLVNGGTMPTSVGYELWRLSPRRIVVLGSSGVIPDSLLGQLQAFTTGPVQRLAGADRYATAAAAAMASFAGPVPVAYVATGQNFPDALAGAPAAAAQGGPLLLATATALPAATVTALQVLKPQRIVVLGGSSVVGTGVATQLSGYTTGAVTRLAGSDRFATAAAIANYAFPGARPSVVLATGTNFPDALAGGPVASVNGGPVLLAKGDCVPASNVAVKSRTGANTVVALGAAAVLPDSAVAFTPCA